MTQKTDISRAGILHGKMTASCSCVLKADFLLNLHIYMIGVGIQQFFILVFLVYAVGFHRKLMQEDVVMTKSKATTLLYTLYFCLCLITVSS